MEDKLTKCLSGFRKLHGTQHLLLTMLEKWKKGIENGAYVSVLFMDLSKDFGTIKHDLLLAKLKAHELSTNAINLMHSYLKNRKQGVQISLVFFIQYSVLSNYADDDDLFVTAKNKEYIKSLFLLDFEIVNNWFCENFMLLNPGKNHSMCLGKNLDDNEILNFNNLTIRNSKDVEI